MFLLFLWRSFQRFLLRHFCWCHLFHCFLSLVLSTGSEMLICVLLILGTLFLGIVKFHHNISTLILSFQGYVYFLSSEKFSSFVSLMGSFLRFSLLDMPSCLYHSFYFIILLLFLGEFLYLIYQLSKSSPVSILLFSPFTGILNT